MWIFEKCAGGRWEKLLKISNISRSRRLDFAQACVFGIAAALGLREKSPRVTAGREEKERVIDFMALFKLAFAQGLFALSAICIYSSRLFSLTADLLPALASIGIYIQRCVRIYI